MEVIVEHLGSVQFRIRARGHFLESDQPGEKRGFDEGMTPRELLPASLGSGAGYCAATYLGKHKLATEGTGVRVTCEPVKDPVPLLSNFIAEVGAPVELTGKHLKDFARPWSTALFTTPGCTSQRSR